MKLFFLAEALTAWRRQFWEALVCIAEAQGVRGFPPSPCNYYNVRFTSAVLKALSYQVLIRYQR